MATISSSSSNGGAINVAEIVSQLMTVERQPLDSLQKKATSLQNDISAFGTIKSLLSTFQDASRGLANTSTYNASTASSANADVVEAVGTSGAIKGNLAISVQELAQAQSAYTGLFASSTAVVGGGTLSVQIGSQTAVDITVPAGATLAQVRDAINRSSAGISASVVVDGGQSRLLVRSNETGVANGFSINVSNAEAGLGALQFSGGGGAMTQAQAPRDALYTMDGMQLTSATNKITDAVEGVTLTLKQQSATPVAISLAPDTAAMRTRVDAFVTAYNALTTKLAELTKYDQATETAGELQGNSAAVRLQQQLRQMLTTTVSGSSLGTLSNAGLEIQRDGTLKVDDAKFSAAAADTNALRTLFMAPMAADRTGGGIATRFNSLITRTIGVDGLLTTALETLNKRKTSNVDQQEAIERRLESTKARLTRLYSTLDANLSSLQNLSSQLTNSLAALNNNQK